MNTTIKNNNLIVGIPTNIKNQIDKLFQSKYSQNDINKIYFIVHQINKQGSYQLHIRKHAWMLSFNCGELSDILTRLININIIQLDKGYVVGSSSNSYSLVQPFDYKSTNCYRNNYYAGQVKFPIWVQKFVADGGIAKGAEYTNWKKEAAPAKPVNDDKRIIEQLKLQVKMLQDKLSQYEVIEAEIVAAVEAKPLIDTNTSSTTLIAKNGTKIVLVNAEKYSDLVINNIKRIYEPSRKIICVKDEFRNNIYFNNVDSVVTLQPVN